MSPQPAWRASQLTICPRVSAPSPPPARLFTHQTFPLLLPFYLHSPTITRLSLLATLSPIFLTVIIIVKTIALHRNGLAIEPAMPLAGTDFGAVVAGNGLGRGGIWGGISESFLFSDIPPLSPSSE